MLRLVWQIQDVLSAVIIADCEADSVSTPREQSLRGAVLVHPLASLPPKQPGVDILCQKWARAVLGVAQSAVQDAHYGQACIQPCGRRPPKSHAHIPNSPRSMHVHWHIGFMKTAHTFQNRADVNFHQACRGDVCSHR